MYPRGDALRLLPGGFERRGSLMLRDAPRRFPACRQRLERLDHPEDDPLHSMVSKLRDNPVQKGTPIAPPFHDEYLLQNMEDRRYPKLPKYI